MTDDSFNHPLEKMPRRRRDRFVLPGWAWPILGVACLLIGLILGWVLWRPTPSPEPTQPPAVTAVAEAPTYTPTAITTPTSTPSPTGTPLPTDTATSTFTPTPNDTSTPTSTPTSDLTITVGGRVKVSGTGAVNLRLRSGPGTEFITFKIVAEGSILEVLGGPEEADGHTWWRLKDDQGVIGWAAADWLVPVP